MGHTRFSLSNIKEIKLILSSWLKIHFKGFQEHECMYIHFYSSGSHLLQSNSEEIVVSWCFSSTISRFLFELAGRLINFSIPFFWFVLFFPLLELSPQNQTDRRLAWVVHFIPASMQPSRGEKRIYQTRFLDKKVARLRFIYSAVSSIHIMGWSCGWLLLVESPCRRYYSD